VTVEGANKYLTVENLWNPRVNWQTSLLPLHEVFEVFEKIEDSAEALRWRSWWTTRTSAATPILTTKWICQLEMEKWTLLETVTVIRSVNIGGSYGEPSSRKEERRWVVGHWPLPFGSDSTPIEPATWALSWEISVEAETFSAENCSCATFETGRHLGRTVN